MGSVRKSLAGGLGLTLTAGLVLAEAGAAFAQHEYGWKACASSEWSYSSVTSTKSVTHYHEIPAQWKSSTKSSGFSSYKGWKDEGPVWMELNSTGSFSTHHFGCSV